MLLICALMLTASADLTLKQLTQDPAWMGRAPHRAWWADDGQSILFRRQAEDGVAFETIELDPGTGDLRVVEDANLPLANSHGGAMDQRRQRRLFAHGGDLFIKHVGSSRVQRLTETQTVESSPRFLADDRRIMFRRDGRYVIRDLDSGAEQDVRSISFKDPEPEAQGELNEETKTPDHLEAQQAHLFETLRSRANDRELKEARTEAIKAADTLRRPEPVRLGSGRSERWSSLSPDGRWLAVVSAPKSPSTERDSMPTFVTESGRVEHRSVRGLAGDGSRVDQTLQLVDLSSGEVHNVDTSDLPGIDVDPLAWLDEAGVVAIDETPVGTDTEAESTDAPASQRPEATKTPRPIRFSDIEWSPDGRHLVLQVRSLDHKDRWIAELDLGSGTPLLSPIHHEHDEAWIGRAFTSMDWLRDGSALWFQSEADGWGHLYIWDPGTDEVRQMTQGHWEARSVREGPDGRLWFTAGKERPVTRDVHVLDVKRGTIQRVTEFDASVDAFALDPQGRRVLMRVSSATRPPEIVVQEARAGATPRWLTDSRSEAYLNLDMPGPEIVAIPSPHGGELWAKLYLPPEDVEPSGAAVLFLHGAGYLQNADNQWSSYAREHLFNMHLAGRGAIVLDLDYRASSGYGRDHRAAIYRQMGTPEVEDMETAIKWLAAEHGVDPERVGAYGGSYGGFLVLMAMFKAPDLLACGAALRPVTDWMHYSDGYTTRILNRPQRDGEAYRVSSPIEHAEGLSAPLLICHGMIDDNVFFKDTVRLTQRLIELEKTNWDVAMYPVEAHGFREDASWLDEFRRIDSLFTEQLNLPR